MRTLIIFLNLLFLIYLCQRIIVAEVKEEIKGKINSRERSFFLIKKAGNGEQRKRIRITDFSC